MTICKTCSKKASFNFIGEKARFCAAHKESEMVDVLNKKCSCGMAQPRWNFEGLPALFCSSCKEDGMVEPNRNLCKCDKKVRPCFNFENLKAEFCNSCKEDGMVNVIDKQCFCKKVTSPLYNFEGLVGNFCGDCKSDGMIDVKNTRCFCKKSRPTFNLEGLNARFCKDCKTIDMVDTRHKKCFCGKASTANFNYDGLKNGEYCGKCKLPTMVDIRHPRCLCNIQPTYNYEGLPPKFCAKCKTLDMVDVIHIKCKTNLCDLRVQEKYEGYCFRCFIYTFPDKPISRNYKTKEFAVVEYILEEFSSFTWITDKSIQDGCSRKRPDLLLDLGYQIVIIEVDENQHRQYDCNCDNKRLMTISQDVGHRPIIFIRFNPDDYNNQLGEKMSSSWGITSKTGIIKIKNKKEWVERLSSLKNQIEYWINPENKTDKLVEVVQLYYDQNI